MVAIMYANFMRYYVCINKTYTEWSGQRLPLRISGNERINFDTMEIGIFKRKQDFWNRYVSMN